MKVLPISHAARVQPHLFALQDAGVDIERKLGLNRLPSRILYKPEVIVSTRSIGTSIVGQAGKQGIENIDMLGADREGVQNLEPWFRDYLMGASTLNELLERYCSVARWYIPWRRFSLVRDARLARICIKSDMDLEKESWLWLGDWANILLLLKLFRNVLGQAFLPEAITTESRGPITPAKREMFPGVPIHQGWIVTSIVLPKTLLATPLPRRPRTLPVPDGSPVGPESVSFPDQMRGLLKPCLSDGWLDVHVAAEMAGCSTRSLQRRLSGAGLTFSKLLDQSRMEVAKAMLEDNRNKVTDVGFEVGFEDVAHFSRAFRRVNGVTPRQYQKEKMSA